MVVATWNVRPASAPASLCGRNMPLCVRFPTIRTPVTHDPSRRGLSSTRLSVRAPLARPGRHRAAASPTDRCSAAGGARSPLRRRRGGAGPSGRADGRGRCEGSGGPALPRGLGPVRRPDVGTGRGRGDPPPPLTLLPPPPLTLLPPSRLQPETLSFSWFYPLGY